MISNKMTSNDIVSKIGETDQQFLTDPSPELAKLRANLRVRLVEFSHQKAEKIYFLTEAVMLLELALMQTDQLDQHLELSTALGNAYLHFYHVTQETRYLTICKQVAKPLSHHANFGILLILTRLSAVEKQQALLQHWMTKLMQQTDVDINAIASACELDPYCQEDWFKQLIKPYLH